MRKLLSILTTLVVTVCANAQMLDPVHFTSKLEMLSGDEAQIVFAAKIDNGWHVYSTGLETTDLFPPHSIPSKWTA